MRVPAVVPAAGRSVRMGMPKLTLDLGGSTAIGRVVRALVEGGASPVLVVTASTTEPGGVAAMREAAAAGAMLLPLGGPTADMLASVVRGLLALQAAGRLGEGWMLCPADQPGVTAEAVRAVLAAFAEDPSRIVVPVAGGRRGHPVAFPAETVAEVMGLGPDEGINRVVAARADLVREIAWEDERLVEDLDTPEDYARWRTTGAPPGG